MRPDNKWLNTRCRQLDCPVSTSQQLTLHWRIAKFDVFMPDSRGHHHLPSDITAALTCMATLSDTSHSPGSTWHIAAVRSQRVLTSASTLRLSTAPLPTATQSVKTQLTHDLCYCAFKLSNYFSKKHESSVGHKLEKAAGVNKEIEKSKQIHTPFPCIPYEASHTSFSIPESPALSLEPLRERVNFHFLQSKR